MTASQHTENYNLPIFEPNDIPQWLGDSDSWNATMKILDQAIKDASAGGGGGTPINVVQNTGDSVTDVMSQKAVTDALPAILQSTGDSQTATMSQDAITKALSGGTSGTKVFATQLDSTQTGQLSTITNYLTLENLPAGQYYVEARVMGDCDSPSSNQANIGLRISLTEDTSSLLNNSTLITLPTGTNRPAYSVAASTILTVEENGEIHFIVGGRNLASGATARVQDATLMAIKLN